MEMLRTVLHRLDSIDLRLDELVASVCAVERAVDQSGEHVATTMGSLRAELAAAVAQAVAARQAARKSGAAVEGLNRRLLLLALVVVVIAGLNRRLPITTAVRAMRVRSLLLLLTAGLASSGIARATVTASKRLPLVGAYIEPLASSRTMHALAYGGAACAYAAAAGLPWKLLLALYTAVAGGRRPPAAGAA